MIREFGLILGADAAEPTPQPDPLVSCQSDLAVVSQYAIQQNKSRTTTEQDLARANARIAVLEEQIKQSQAKKPEEKKPEK